MSKGISRTVSLWLVFVSSHLLSMNALQSQEVHTSNGNLQIRSTKDGLEFMNARIKCHLTLVNGVYQQDFLALDRSNRWRLVASAFQTRGISPKSQDVSPLLRPGKSDERQFTANVLTRIDSLKQGQDSAVVILGGQSGNHYITEKIVLHSDTDFVDIEITDAVHDTIPPLFELLLSHFTFQPDGKKLSEYERPDFLWTPNLRPQDDQVIGDHVFRSPAVILQHKELFAALVPDLDTLVEQRPMPTILNLDLKSGATNAPLFAYGFADYVPVDHPHTYYRHDTTMTRRIGIPKLRYGFQLFLSAQAPHKRGYRRIAQYLWSRYGHRYLQSPQPQVMPFVEYAKSCYPAAFSYIANEKNGLKGWQEFELDGQKVGGVISGWGQDTGNIPNQAWFCNLRSAWGMHWFGKRMKDAELTRKAELMLELALAGPEDDGLFPSCFNVLNREWIGNYWKFDTTWVNSFARDVTGAGWKIRPQDYTTAYYQTASASWKCIWLLRWYRDFVQHPRILPYCKRYAEFLLAHTDKSGCVPAWFTKDLKSCKQLRFNAEGGVHAWFLAELYGLTRDSRYLDAAERMIGFLTKQIIPQQKWYDFETFYSVSPKPEGMFDQHSGQWPQSTLSIHWAAGALAKLYEVTRKNQYLTTGMNVLDYLSFYQNVWPIQHLRSAYTFGGFGVQNTDSEHNDARQSQFGDTYFDYYRLTGKPEYFERGVAAIRTSLALVNLKAVIRNMICINPRYPEGLEPENFGHGGTDSQGGRSGFDRGEGSALAGVAYAIAMYGSVYIDLKHQRAFTVDGCSVESLKIDGEKINLQLNNGLVRLSYPHTDSYELIVRGMGGDRPSYQLTINSQTKILTKEELERGVIVSLL